MEPEGHDPGALSATLAEWTTFFHRCLSQRLSAGRFRHLVQALHHRKPLPAVFIADLFLRPQASNDMSLDPRIPPYIQVLTRLKYIDAPAVLVPLYKHSSLHLLLSERTRNVSDQRPEAESKKDSSHARNAARCWKNSSWFEELFFLQLMRCISDGTAYKDAQTGLMLLKVLCDWMNLFTSVSTAYTTDMLQDFQSAGVRKAMDVSRTAFASLLVRVVEDEELVRLIGGAQALSTRRELSESLSNFLNTMQLVPLFSAKLDLFRTETLARLDPVFKNKQAATNAALDELLGTTVGLENRVLPDIGTCNTRAGLFVYLNAALVGRPLIDDHAILAYLHNRYQGDLQSSAIDLTLASFDVLANAVFRNEGWRDAQLLRSFLVNKLPLLLCYLCPPQFSTTSSEFCITTALSQVDTSIFPTASLMFDESRSNNPYTESVREDFCTSCALHGLVEREHVEKILGETSMSYEPSLEKYSKEKLVRDCLTDSEKVQGLVREMERMDGNVGAVCHASVDIMRQLCQNKETTTLKLLCSQLVQKPQSLDVLLLFEKLPTILGPLCQLLDGWAYDEDHEEYQPIYEEFGAILLLAFAFAYRYSLTMAEIASFTAPGSVTARILSQAHVGRSVEELSEPEKERVNKWLIGLFDNETGCLGDDLMSACRPQDFYLLIPPIMQQIVRGYAHGFLTDESLKSGIEYVVDTFLLPSLVPAIRFLSSYLWVEQKDQKSVVRVLQLILLPHSISGEASAMLSSVKTLVARPLEHALRSYQKQDPKNQDIEPLLRTIKDNLPLSRRTNSAERQELESWASGSSNGICGVMRHAVQGLVQWSSMPGSRNMPASYTHRQVLVSCRAAGTRRVLDVLLEEIRVQVAAGNAGIAYDVVAALLCAPEGPDQPVGDASVQRQQQQQQQPLTLRDWLAMQTDGYQRLQKEDAELAEIVLRLHRRIQELTAPVQQPGMLQVPPNMGLELDEVPDGLGEAMATCAGDGAEGTADGLAVDGMALDMGLSNGVANDDGGDGSFSVSAKEADMFRGLDASLDMFQGWDGLDLGGSGDGGVGGSGGN